MATLSRIAELFVNFAETEVSLTDGLIEGLNRAAGVAESAEKKLRELGWIRAEAIGARHEVRYRRQRNDIIAEDGLPDASWLRDLRFTEDVCKSVVDEVNSLPLDHHSCLEPGDISELIQGSVNSGQFVDALKYALAHLKDSHRKAVIMYFGIDEGSYSRREMANELGKSSKVRVGKGGVKKKAGSAYSTHRVSGLIKDGIRFLKRGLCRAIIERKDGILSVPLSAINFGPSVDFRINYRLEVLKAETVQDLQNIALQDLIGSGKINFSYGSASVLQKKMSEWGIRFKDDI
tara:strand:+ start:571 stop:1443 length:873 start_codon:yes stop_codon:yes gene_type:complete